MVWTFLNTVKLKCGGINKEWMDGPIEFSSKTRWIFSALMTQTRGFARFCSGARAAWHKLTRFFVIWKVVAFYQLQRPAPVDGQHIIQIISCPRPPSCPWSPSVQSCIWCSTSWYFAVVEIFLAPARSPVSHFVVSVSEWMSVSSNLNYGFLWLSLSLWMCHDV